MISNSLKSESSAIAGIANRIGIRITLHYRTLCILPLLPIALTGCTQAAPQEIVLIVKEAPDQSLLQRDDGSSSTNIYYSDLTYLDDAGAVRQKRFKAPVDTIRITVNRPFVEVGMQFKGIEEAYFLLKNGDSIDVTYRNGYPHFSSRTNPNLTYSYNLATSIPNRTVGGSFDVLTSMEKNWYLHKRLKENPSYPKLLPRIYRDYSNPFDLAKQQGLFISALKDTLTANRERVEESFYSYYLYQSAWRGAMWETTQLKMGTLQSTDIPAFIDDGHADFLTYRRLLFSYFISPAISKDKWKIYGVQRTDYRYDKIFDHLLTLNLPLKSRKILMEFCVEGMVESGSASQIKALTEKFVQITGDQQFVEELLCRSEVTFESGDKLNLVDAEGNRTNLDAVLERNRGKVVYVDFWASWCAPCVGAMPAAVKLREDFKGRDVAFVYLAFNDKREPWKSAVLKHRVNHLSESYFITNSRSSDFITKMKVKLIPRYLLFDKTGKLAHANAPGPDSKAVRDEINKLLR